MRRALVVDDSAVIRSVVRTYLVGLGLELDFAESSEEAIDRFQPGETALVITDLNLDGMNGLELAKRLRSRAAPRPLPVVLITSSKDVDKQELIRSGAVDAFLSKPLQREELCSIVTRLLPADAEVPSSRKRAKPLRVLLADDSALARTILSRILGADASFTVVGQAEDGEQALALAIKERPEICLLDAQLPTADGASLTERIMKEAPTRIVLVTDDESPRAGAAIFAATLVGALDVIARPAWCDPNGDVAEAFRAAVSRFAEIAMDAPASSAPPPQTRRPPSLRTMAAPSLVGISSSTGGPHALAALLPALSPALDSVAVVIVQAGPPGFAEALVEWLRDRTKVAVRLARHGDTLRPGKVLVAPDHHHVVLSAPNVVELVDGPPVKGRRPSATPLFESMGRHLGERGMGLILTGTSDDGVDGLAALVAAGGAAIVQSPETCVARTASDTALARGIAMSLPLAAIGAEVVARASLPARARR